MTLKPVSRTVPVQLGSVTSSFAGKFLGFYIFAVLPSYSMLLFCQNDSYDNGLGDEDLCRQVFSFYSTPSTEGVRSVGFPSVSFSTIVLQGVV